jgi:hypothetical protein
MARRKGDFWASIINNLTGPFPEIGSEPPLIETSLATPVKETNSKTIDPEAIGNLSKVTVEMYLFFTTENKRQFLMQNQTMRDLGEMTLEEAAEIVKNAKKKR